MAGSAVIFVNQPGALPLNTIFKSPSDLPVILAVSGSAWAESGGKLVGMDIAVDGKVLGSAMVYCNEPGSHRALIPVLIPMQLSIGEHKLALTARANTLTDFNDYFNVTLLY
jgi:hypothetical protein